MKKKWIVGLFCGLILLVGVLGINTKPVSVRAESNAIFTVKGIGSIQAEKSRLGRSLVLSELSPTPYYVKKGESFQVYVTSSHKSADGILLAIGTPDTPNGFIKKELTLGENTITADRDGVVSWINRQNDGTATYRVDTPLEKIPYFELGKTTKADFAQQMAEMADAPVIQLVSQKALITVSYNSAKKYLEDPEALMTYYDQFITAENEIEGTSDSGRADYLSAQHRQHYVESEKLYMYATNEFMGFHGDGALSRLLRTNNGWGVWHESGHQRQVSAMQWSGVGEVTVNIYSMAAQQAITGKVSAMDAYQTQVQNYLAKGLADKNYDAQENYVKLGMYWQLMDVFGAEFYPQLHQNYRLLDEKPTTNLDKKQVFIIQTSKVAGVNLIPFFEKWGIEPTAETKDTLENYPVLKQPIWLDSDETKYRLPLSERQYVPELPYFKKVVKSISATDSRTYVTFDSNWLKGYKYVITKNGKYIGEVTNGHPYYGSGSLNNDQYTIAINGSVSLTDKISVEVRFAGTRVLKTYSRQNADLEAQLRALFTDNTQSELKDTVKQDTLDTLLKAIQQSDDTDSLMKLYDKAQTLLLEQTIGEISYKNNQILVPLKGTDYKCYRIVLVGDKYLSEIEKGGGVYYSQIQDGIWKTNYYQPINDGGSFHIEFRLPNKTYILQMTTGKELLLKNTFEEMYDSEGHIKSSVTQEDLNQVLKDINSYGRNQKQALLQQFDQVQLDYLQGMILSVTVNSQSKMEVQFANDLYKRYKIVMVKNGGYMAELTNGKAYYSSLSGNTWRSSATISPQDQAYIEVRLSNKTYRIKTMGQ